LALSRTVQSDAPTLEPRTRHGREGISVLASEGAAAHLAQEDAWRAHTRFRRALIAGCTVWCLFTFVDWGVVEALDAGPLVYFVSLRALLVAIMLPILWRLSRGPAPSQRELTFFDLAVYASGAALIGLMCVEFRGLASPYANGVCLAILARTVTAQDPWPRGLLLNGVPIAAFYVLLLGSALVSPRVAAQLHDRAAVATLALNSSYILSTCIFLVVGGHIVWSLRKQLSEARSVGRYKLKRCIGKGATGEVWIAHHAAIKRDIAVKILRPEVLDTIAIARFEREVRATAELEHPNTVRVFDFGTTEDGLWFYAMELLSGENLTELVLRDGPLAPQRAARLALQATRALGEAHRRGIVHRDVKPSNLFVTDLGGGTDFVKLLDFGIARFSGAAGKASGTLTKDGGILGTPEYMSPEAVTGREVDARADVYGIGAVLYFMLTGHPPFDSAEAGTFGVLLAHLHRAPLKPSERLGRDVPSALEAIVMRCLEKDPEARYASAEGLETALVEFTERSAASTSREEGT
jgi:tRNA A-37 threonylcarbamoyl transferase component Bud32